MFRIKVFLSLVMLGRVVLFIPVGCLVFLVCLIAGLVKLVAEQGREFLETMWDFIYMPIDRWKTFSEPDFQYREGVLAAAARDNWFNILKDAFKKCFGGGL